MAEIRGNIIQITGKLMAAHADARDKADEELFTAYGKHWDEIGVDDWVDTKMWNVFMTVYANSSVAKEEALILVGEQVYPTIKAAGQIPPEIDTPLKMLKFEGEGFKLYHRGEGVTPRKFLKEEEGEVIVEAPSPGYDCKVIEGVFRGILKIFDKEGTVEQTKCVKKGDSTCVYEIKWK